MGKKPSHNVVCISETQDPWGVFECEDCKAFFNVEPDGEGTVLVDGRLYPCCPMDPANEGPRRYWKYGGNDSVTHYLGFAAEWEDEEYREEIETFFEKKESCGHEHDCCGCWFQHSEVAAVVRDGWVYYRKTYNRNI